MSDPYDDVLGRRVRPYMITGGRTRPIGGLLPVEATVRRTPLGDTAAAVPALERGRILLLTGQPVSVAELAARVGVHLGVLQVLLGDLAAEGLVSVHRPDPDAGRPDIALLERVLHGLRAL